MSTNDDKYTLSPAWEHGRDYKTPFDYTIEATGQTVLIRHLDMGDLLKLGIAEELDFMTKTLMTDEKSEKAQEAVANAIMKADNFQRMEKMINLVCVAGVLKPQLHIPPEHEAARQAGLIYADSIPFNDRMELFSVIFETEGLSTFRTEQEDGVGDIQHVSDVPLPSDDVVAELQPNEPEGVLSQ
jgi:hypothetical protein